MYKCVNVAVYNVLRSGKSRNCRQLAKQPNINGVLLGSATIVATVLSLLALWSHTMTSSTKHDPELMSNMHCTSVHDYVQPELASLVYIYIKIPH